MIAAARTADSIATFRAAAMGQPDSRLSPRRLLGVITAGAVAVSMILAAAMPAQAGNRKDDLAKALIAALVIGAIIHETRKDDVAPALPAPEPARKKKRPHDHDADIIPTACALEFEGNRRNVTVYPERCLLRQGLSRRELPRDCATRARIYGEWDRVYSVQCLRSAGFDLRDDHRRDDHRRD